ncbi:MAG: Tad domain-containing protein [Pirellulales bacterium]
MFRHLNSLGRCLADDAGRSAEATQSLAGCERGFLSFVTCVAVLFFALLVTMVFNVGAAVRQKVEVQNAADAAILTSTSMTARGLNAVTLTNHMLGELSAILIIHEALGGTELDDLAPKDERKQSNVSNILNKSLTTLLPLSSSYELHALDEQAVKQMKKDGGSDDDSQGKHQAFATIFDARCTMKYYMTEVLIGRLVAIACRFIPFGIGEAIYWGINIPLTVLVGKMLQEVIIIDGVEKIAKIFSTVAKRNIVESRMLPFLENYGEVCFKQFPVIGERVAQENAKRNNVTLHLFPARLPLPIEREPAPPAESQSILFGREPQGGNASSDADFLSKALDLLGSATSLLGDANDVLGTNGGVQNPGASLRPNPGDDGYDRGAQLEPRFAPTAFARRLEEGRAIAVGAGNLSLRSRLAQADPRMVRRRSDGFASWHLVFALDQSLHGRQDVSVS